jgi:hypothetical protein
MSRFIVCVIAFGVANNCSGVAIKRTVSAHNPLEALNRVLSANPNSIPVYSHRIGR